MSNRRIYLLCFISFVAGCLLASYFDFYFRQIVIRLYLLSSNGKIRFVGKNFLFFSGIGLLVSFGVYCAVLVYRICKVGIRKVLVKIIVSIFTFFFSLVCACFYLGTAAVIECTACKGIRKLRYEDLPYDTIFIACLAISLVVFVIMYWRKKSNQIKQHR